MPVKFDNGFSCCGCQTTAAQSTGLGDCSEWNVLELADSLVIGEQRCRLLHFASRTVDDYFRMYVFGFREHDGTD